MLISIGEVIKAQGIKGEVKVSPLTGDINRFKRLSLVFIGGTSFEVRSVRIDGGFVYMSFNGVPDRNAAEKLVGKSVEIDRSEAKQLSEGEFFISDIIGCEVYLSDGTFVGKVDYVYQHGAADVYEVKGEKDVMFPFLNKLVASVDVSAKKIVLVKDEFERVAVYED